MFKINRTDVIDTDLYDERINHTGFILFDKGKMRNETDYYTAHYLTCCDLARLRMIYKSANQRSYMDRNTIIDYLLDDEHCPEHYLMRGKNKSFSLDSKKVLSVLLEHGYAQDFIENYMEYRSWKTKCGKLESILKSCNEEHGVSCDGAALYKLPFTASIQVNRRFNYHDFDIISQIPKSMGDCIAVEDGYFLAWGDFAQSDFRIAYNLFLRSPENDALLNKYDDKYEALARMLAANANEKFDLEEFKRDRKIYKKNTLATFYGLRNSAIEEESVFIRKLAAFYESMPRYKEFLQNIDKYATLELPMYVTSYFGFDQMVSSGFGMTKASMTYEALNMPIQTGSSEIVIATVNHILDTCYAMGYTEDDISLYMTRHDEPIFKIRESAKDLMKVLIDHSKVIVDDWSPLQLDWEFGYRYKSIDEKLTETFNSMQDSFVETVVTPTPCSGVEYVPIPKAIVMSAGMLVTPDNKTIVCFYDVDNNEAMYSLFETTDKDEIITECKLKFRDAVSAFLAEGLKTVAVKSDFLGNSDFLQGVTFEYFKMDRSQEQFRAQRLCQMMYWRYCKQQGLESAIDRPILTTYDTWIGDVKDSHLLIRG